MLPILPLKAVLTPDMRLKVQLTDKRYTRLVERCMQNAGELAVVFCSDYRDELGGLANVGCQARIEHVDVLDDCVLVELLGLRRFTFSSVEPKLNIYYADGVQFIEDRLDMDEHDPILASVLDMYQSYLRKLSKLGTEEEGEKPLASLSTQTTFTLLNALNLPLDKRQEALEILSVKKRYEFLLTCLRFELEMLSFITSNELVLSPEFEVEAQAVLN